MQRDEAATARCGSRSWTTAWAVPTGPAARGCAGSVDRVAAADGALEITSPQGGGTRIVVSFPSTSPTPGPAKHPDRSNRHYR